jgi:hypothetical protein
MKIRYTVLFVVLAAFAAVLSWAIAGKATENQAGGPGGIPLPVGQFSFTAQGSLALCFNPSTFALEACSTVGVLVVPLSVLDNGALTLDQNGGCGTMAQVINVLPVNGSPPTITPNSVIVETLLDYDSTSGTGDLSFTRYIGGTCHGATFDSSGATEEASVTQHFTVSRDGNRIDSIVTQFTNPSVGAGGFSESGTELRQTGPES